MDQLIDPEKSNRLIFRDNAINFLLVSENRANLNNYSYHFHNQFGDNAINFLWLFKDISIR